MKVAIIGTSRKENERRVAIHPNHLKMIPERIRGQLFFERGYGMAFGMDDETIYSLTGNRPEPRETLIHDFKAIVIPKPVEEDFREIHEGSLVWGWNHCVQQQTVTQLAIEKKLTLISWENMYHHGVRGRTHIFETNNEMAGYCGVQHALQLTGIDGNFGLKRMAIVLSLGSVSRGAIYALKGHGFDNITVYTRRPPFLVSNKLPGVRYRQILRDETGKFNSVNMRGEIVPLIEELTCADVIVNGLLQNPSDPVMFVDDQDLNKFKKPCLVIDVSCDAKMGFSFAHPTEMSNPTFKVGHITYYSVDHTPTLLWESATWEISNCILPYLESFVEQKENEVLHGAIDIRQGIVINKDILTYQNRSTDYPYTRIERERGTCQKLVSSDRAPN